MNYFILFVVFTFLVFIIYLKNESSPIKNGQADIRNKINQHLPTILFILILIIGIVVRTHRFGNIPNGVNVDEASTGYDGFALANYGIDMNGFRNPVALIAFGTGHQALYAYFSAPFIAVFGLNQFSIRITNLIFGILSLIVFYLLVRKVDNQKVAMFALFLLATNPWHVMISRWGLDCNLFPAIFLIATYLLTFSEEKPVFFILSMAIYGLALYSYEASFFLIPVYILFLISYLFFQGKIQKKYLLIGLITIFVVGLPIILYLIINIFDLDPIITNWITIPKSVGYTRYSTVSSIFSDDNFLTTSLTNFIALIKLLIFQNDGLFLHNYVPGYGITFLFSFPFQLIGLWVLINENKKGLMSRNAVLLIWLVAAILLGTVLKININRVNILYLPIIYLIAKSVDYLHEHIRIPAVLIMVVFVLGFIFFTDAYFHEWPEIINPAFYESIDQAINYAADNTDKTIYVSRTIDRPFIYVLFYRKINPHEYLDSVVYEYPRPGKRDVSSFGQYRFLDLSDMPPNGGAYIVANDEIEQLEIDNLNITEFKNFSVLMP